MGNFEQERERILKTYESYDAGGWFGFQNLAHFVRVQERYRWTLCLLKAYGFHPLGPLRILDVGCGDGSMLRQFLEWGAEPENLAGIDLRPEPVKKARHLNPSLDIRCGCATSLPWSSAQFHLVCQHTVFTSVLHSEMRQQIAREMARCCAVGGAVLWYDFAYDNPRNPHVRGANAREIRSLFPGFEVHLQRITLAPFIARRIPDRFLPIVYPILASVPLLCTHYLGLFIKREETLRP